MIIKILKNLRHTVIVAVISSFIGSFLMLYIGAKKIFTAVWGYFGNLQDTIAPAGKTSEEIAHLSMEDLAVGNVIESLDAFLLALVLLYFGFGVYSLCIMKEGEAAERGTPKWLIPKSIGHLKETLTHVIIVVLFVLFVRLVWLHFDNLTWELLILPASIALLALGLKFTELAEKKNVDK